MEVISYNILCPVLATPKTYPKCKVEYLQPLTRKKMLFQKFESFIQRNAIVCLQEVPQMWVGDFHRFFNEKGYAFLSSNYGDFKNNFMGIAIAYPMNTLNKLTDSAWVTSGDSISGDKFVLKDCNIIHIGGEMKPPKSTSFPLFRRVYYYILKIFSFIDKIKKFYEKLTFSPWIYASRRNNTMIFTRFLFNDKPICIANYHMPCAFWNREVMLLHSKQLLISSQKLAGEDPLILAGDFNTKPYDPVYNRITGLASEIRSIPNNSFFPLKSAYFNKNNQEPAATYSSFTTFSVKEFRDTIDYIFYSDRLRVTSVLQVPNLQNCILPNAEEPSDHVAIGATFEFT